jgi:hypothetical protein
MFGIPVIVRAKARTYLRGKGKGKCKGHSNRDGQPHGRRVSQGLKPMFGIPVIVRAKARTYLRSKGKGYYATPSKRSVDWVAGWGVMAAASA